MEQFEIDYAAAEQSLDTLQQKLTDSLSLLYGYWRHVTGPKELEPDTLVRDLFRDLQATAIDRMKANPNLDLGHVTLASLLLVHTVTTQFNHRLAEITRAQAAVAAQ